MCVETWHKLWQYCIKIIWRMHYRSKISKFGVSLLIVNAYCPHQWNRSTFDSHIHIPSNPWTSYDKIWHNYSRLWGHFVNQTCYKSVNPPTFDVLANGWTITFYIYPYFTDMAGCSWASRVVYKLGIMVFNCLHGQVPLYLVELCQPVAGVASRQHLRSATRPLLVVPRHRLSFYGRRAFCVAGPSVWNSLSDSLRNPVIGGNSFRQFLKTFLFATYR